MSVFVYRLLNDSDQTIFVGTTRDETQETLTKKFENKWWGHQVNGVDMSGPLSQGQASYQKELLLRKHRPRFNKSYMYAEDNIKYQRQVTPVGGIKRKLPKGYAIPDRK
jgi:hypothetical protein